LEYGNTNKMLNIRHVYSFFEERMKG